MNFVDEIDRVLTEAGIDNLKTRVFIRDGFTKALKDRIITLEAKVDSYQDSNDYRTDEFEKEAMHIRLMNEMFDALEELWRANEKHVFSNDSRTFQMQVTLYKND